MVNRNVNQRGTKMSHMEIMIGRSSLDCQHKGSCESCLSNFRLIQVYKNQSNNSSEKHQWKNKQDSKHVFNSYF